VLTSLPVLDPVQCALVREQVLAQREHWSPRGGEPPWFHTLGAAAYIDAGGERPEQGSEYTAKTAVLNPILRARFGWVHNMVKYALSVHLNACVRDDPELALPGFHIWLGLSVPTSPDMSRHFDLQYRQLPWSGRARADHSCPLSFTLPIVMPRAGGGLNSWDVTLEEREAQFRSSSGAPTVEELVQQRVLTHHPYSPGVLVLHSGHLLHQIAPVDTVYPDDERITLQGHALRCDGEWVIYW
jgi:hypothetical protein